MIISLQQIQGKFTEMRMITSTIKIKEVAIAIIMSIKTSTIIEIAEVDMIEMIEILTEVVTRTIDHKMRVVSNIKRILDTSKVTEVVTNKTTKEVKREAIRAKVIITTKE
jgi:hypothetical protein